MHQTSDMAEKQYKGRRVRNTHTNKYMHLVARYKFQGRIEGIYSDAFDMFVDELAKRIRRDQQNVVVVEGDTGSGKSAFALNLCVALSRKLGKSFDLSKDYIYASSDLWAKLADPDAGPISLLDEGSVTIASMNATRKDDKDIMTLFNTMRSRGWTTIICNPSIMRINQAVRMDHVDYKIRCNSPEKPLIRGFGRGFFQCRKANRHEFKKGDPFWELIYTGVFGDYPPSLKEEYLAIKNSHQDELMERMVRRAKTEEAQERAKAEKYLNAPPEDPSERPPPAWADEE